MLINLPESRERFLVFGQNGNLMVDANKSEGITKHTYSNGEFAEALNGYFNEQMEFQQKSQQLNQEFQQASMMGDSIMIVNLSKGFEKVMADHQRVLVDIAKENGAFGAFIALNELHSVEALTLDSIYSNIPVSAGSSPMVMELKKRVDVLKRVRVGEPLVDVAHPDTAGQLIRLSDQLGDSYTLVDFWASWCGPCRAENPNVVDAFNRYKDKGFTVVGISLDRGKEEWVKAINDDNLTWAHMSDLQFWDSEPAAKYGVRSIPSNVMLDENGVIVAKDLREQELQDWLAERLN
ncbi:MAG: TlpA family protein disulfide reductase [Flavobacteriia bacterium]|nr:TlpA family protein disulfide reductase [Flavobacteriia bacterium]